MSNGLLSQIGETKERLAAWVFRGLIAAGLAVLGWLLSSTVDDIKSNSRATWASVAETNKAIAEMSTSLATLSTAVDIHNKVQDSEEADHELRLRALEKR